MARHKNFDWNLPDGSLNVGGGRTHSWESIHAALLIDIRQELQRLNTLLHCSNFVGIPHQLEHIKANTAKPKRKAAR